MSCHDSLGNLLSKSITDTAAGQSRVWTHTYNSLGQVLTEDGPRRDASDVTAYTYGSQGSFATVTDPVAT